ncbi:MAG TPA: YciI family protein [Miltoncostaeaceae bacterium]|nr:YciI family protein [Miltoncostaeaceae bacterium]
MRYLLLIHIDETGFADAGDEAREMMDAYMRYSEAIQAEGIMRGGDALHPSGTATVVRVRDGETLLSDGPYAEAREQLGGYYEVECESLDQAIDAARRIPGAAFGAIEVRPIVEFA